MKWSALENAVRKYADESKGDKPYRNVISKKYLEDPITVTTDQVRRDIFSFLNLWRCRIPVTSEIVDSLLSLIHGNAEMLRALRRRKFDSFDPGEFLEVGNEKIRIQTAVHILMDKFCYCGNRFTGVAASKTLHLFAPNFLIMWDNYIAPKFGCDDLDGYSYATVFLPAMKRELDELVSDTISEGLCRDRGEAIEHIRTLGGYRRGIPKVLDECNYARYSR